VATSRLVRLLAPVREGDRPVPWPVVGAYLLVAVVVAYGEVAVVGRAWEVCRVSSAAAYGFPLGMSLLLLIVVNVVVLFAAAAGRVPTQWTLLLAGVLLAGVAWAFFAWAGLPLARESCPGAEPGWWPTWLPPSRSR
jgi:hypothetical protein